MDTTWKPLPGSDAVPYHSFNNWLKSQFGADSRPQKIYKLSLDGGFTCPNRDGTLGTQGCIFCSEGGSGDFAASAALLRSNPACHAGEPTDSGYRIDIGRQIEEAKKRIAAKSPNGPYIAYFQSFTNTYAPVSYLEELFGAAIHHPEIAALSIGTRPDCLEPEKIELLARLNRIKPVWVELGLQTIHPSTAEFIRRGYPLSCFVDAFARLKAAGITVIVHLILGLPGETKEMMLESVRYIAALPADGVKLQLLHILKGTVLADYYRKHPFPLFSCEEYVDFVIRCIELLPPSVVIHRLTGDGPKSLLIAPEWSANKKMVLNMFTRRFKELDAWQGKYFFNHSSS